MNGTLSGKPPCSNNDWSNLRWLSSTVDRFGLTYVALFCASLLAFGAFEVLVERVFDADDFLEIDMIHRGGHKRHSWISGEAMGLEKSRVPCTPLCQFHPRGINTRFRNEVRVMKLRTTYG